MTWLQKMDAVLLCLDKLSDKNPLFSDLENWLNKEYPNQIEKGEIQDITLYLWREQMMYFDDGNGWRLSEYDDRKPNGKYLISCKGKLLRENPGGFVKQKINDDAENSRVERLETSQQKLMGKLNVLTGFVAGGTIALALFELLRMAIDYHWFLCY